MYLLKIILIKISYFSLCTSPVSPFILYNPSHVFMDSIFFKHLTTNSGRFSSNEWRLSFLLLSVSILHDEYFGKFSRLFPNTWVFVLGSLATINFLLVSSISFPLVNKDLNELLFSTCFGSGYLRSWTDFLRNWKIALCKWILLLLRSSV